MCTCIPIKYQMNMEGGGACTCMVIAIIMYHSRVLAYNNIYQGAYATPPLLVGMIVIATHTCNPPYFEYIGWVGNGVWGL